MAALTIPKRRLDDLIELLRQDEYEVIGPRVEEGAIVYGPVASVEELPVGWGDVQEPGLYRLVEGDPDTYFGFAVGPHSWKRYLFPPRTTLWKVERTSSGMSFVSTADEPRRRAFLGVRACELHAIDVQDRVFVPKEGAFGDPHYASARESVFLIGVECQHPAGTCFCSSMGTGPGIETGERTALPMATSAQADLVLTELEEAFVVRSATEAGRRILDRLGGDPADAVQLLEAEERVREASARMTRSVAKDEVPALLRDNLEHPRWDDVARRCLGCTNCTLVCPTCFCSSVKDHSDLSGDSAERVREWDSCFDPDFAYVHGGDFRPTIRARYRQWLTHKFSSWVDQFGVSGCVGCGRCITWCPVGIDVTRELDAFTSTDAQQESPS